jgi:gamma-glutamyltranspeptidase/glutathione hydrolase
MLMQHGKAVMPFGVMGGEYQAVGHVHLLTNLIDDRRDPQSALELARLFHQDQVIEVEKRIPATVIAQLQALGHTIVPARDPIGGGQAIWIDWETGLLTGGSDPRKDGFAFGY